MYLKLAEEEDIKIVERWRTDARGILVFVSPHMNILCYCTPIVHTNHQS